MYSINYNYEFSPLLFQMTLRILTCGILSSWWPWANSIMRKFGMPINFTRINLWFHGFLQAIHLTFQCAIKELDEV